MCTGYKDYDIILVLSNISHCKCRTNSPGHLGIKVENKYWLYGNKLIFVYVNSCALMRVMYELGDR